MKCHWLLLLAVMAWTNAALGSDTDAGFVLRDDGKTTLTLADGAGDIFAYHYGAIHRPDIADARNHRSCYLHPVWGLDGEALTEDFPSDHYHHHGIFWTWPHVEIDGQHYDTWMGVNIEQRFERFLQREVVAGCFVLAVENSWRVGENRETPVMSETVRMTVHPTDGDRRDIDLEFCWVPLAKPITLRGAENKSYGGFTFRFNTGPTGKLRILTSEGAATEDMPEKPLKWVDVTRPGAQTDPETRAGAAIFIPQDHPGDPLKGWPPTWLVRFYGVQCVGWPGVEGKTFQPGEEIRLRYRVCIHRGDWSQERLQREYERYLDADALRAARERIERIRKADVEIRVVDRDGNPLPLADVEVRQTRNAFRFGCNLYMLHRLQTDELNQSYEQHFREVFNFATLPFYAWNYDPERDPKAIPSRHEMVRWCVENGIEPKGHPLTWNHSDPRRFRELGTPATPTGQENPDAAKLKQVYDWQQSRIAQIVTEFRDEITIWDAVNEAVHFERGELQKNAPWLTRTWERYGRIPFTKACFATARQANPDAFLLINDYRRDDAYVALIRELTDAEGRPLYDAIGIQTHQEFGFMAPHRVWALCEKFAPFGKPLHFTETTIRSMGSPRNSGRPSDTPDPAELAEWEARQARGVECFYTMIYSHPAVEALTWWDLSDRGAWMPGGGLLRADMTPKPAFEVLRRLITQEWATNSDFKTDQDGTLRARFTCGEYRITVTRDGRRTEVPFRVERDGGNQLRVEVE